MTDSTQPTFWEPAPARRKRRHKTATTSVDALHKDPLKLHRSERIVLDTLRALGRLTRHQIAHSPGLPLSSVCGRVHRLMGLGHVREVVVDGRKLVIDGRHVVECVIQHTLQRAG